MAPETPDTGVRANGTRDGPAWSGASSAKETKANGHAQVPDLEAGRPQLKSQVSSLARVDVPITVKFRDVRYEVVIRPHEPWFQRLSLKKTGEAMGIVRKEILHGISGAVLPGEMLAMLGPSGSGKTTLLNVLGGRLRQGTSGGILYNDLAYQKSMKRQMGFVTQDDVLYATLTVRETLQYAALLRLPKELTRGQKLQRATEIMEELGIDKCKDTIIGGPFMRGISGGERKRVSIGHELLINPSLMLLDEPTSGLDSTTALRILTTLDQLAKGGRTVITTIHQPSSKMFLMFDKLLLLADGNTLYYGAAKEAMDYFAQRGYTPKYATNPADYLLDLATGEVADGPENAQAVKDELAAAYGQTQGPLELQRIDSLPAASAEDQARSVGKKTWPCSWLEQFALLTFRGIKERRFEALGGLRFVQIVAISVVCGCLWFNSKNRTEADIADQTGILFFESTFWGFFPLFTALFTFPQERQMLNKERAVGMYRLTAYFFARTVGDMPLELIMPFVFTIIVYWMANLKHSAAAYILHLLTLLLAVLVSQSLGLLIGATVMDLKKATTLASVIMLAFLLTGGYFVRQIPVWIRWLKYISFPYYTFRLLLKIQYDPQSAYECPGASRNGTCLIQNAPALHGVPLGGGGIEAMALIIMLIGYRFLAYAALRVLNKGTK